MHRRSLYPRLLACSLALAAPVIAEAAPLDERISSKRADLERTEAREDALSGQIDSLGSRIGTLEDQIGALDRQTAAVQGRLDEKTAELEGLRRELSRLRAQLEKVRAKFDDSREALAARLVSLYKQDSPDVLTVVLEADGFEQLLERTEFLRRIAEQDAAILDRTEALKARVGAETARVAGVEDRVSDAAAEITARRDQLSAARSRKQDAESQLRGVKQGKQSAVADVRAQNEQLEKQLRALEAEQARVEAELAGTSGTFDPGPIKQGSGELIWPVDGAITSPFGPRWGRLHAGIDIGGSEGTPIRAADAGRVVLASPYGGYGNYTCLQHAGGLSTCYAHQSSIGVSVGDTVDQGEVIGAVGNTGASFGAHLHFETRVGGTPQDPMGYL